MTLLKKNLAANFAGSIMQAVISIALIPIFIHFLGVESYAIIGIYATLQALSAILDMGISATLNREMARLSVIAGGEQEMRDLVRSVEVIYWPIAVIIGATVMAMSPFIAHEWVQAGQLSPQAIEQTLIIIGIAMTLQWPASLYAGGLMGLHKQVLLNGIIIIVSIFSGVGAVLILWLVSPTLQAFFYWQIIVNGLKTFLLAWFLWHNLPHAERMATFQKPLLTGIWRFAAGVSGIVILTTILTQLDKIILSKLLTLEMFGYYTLAGTLASSLYILIGPVFYSLYPRFSQLVTLDDQSGLKLLYHQGCQLMSALILPLAAVMAFFSYDILLIWTQNPVTAVNTYALASILVCGVALNGLMYIPWTLQYAHGWTRLALFANLTAIIIQIPLIIFLTSHFQAIGGASASIILNCGYIIFVIPFLHQRLLATEKWRWYWQDVGLPLVVCTITAGVCRLMFLGPMSQIMMAIRLVIVLSITCAVTALVTPTTRNWLFKDVLKGQIG